jgi:hypothetical protein
MIASTKLDAQEVALLPHDAEQESHLIIDRLRGPRVPSTDRSGNDNDRFSAVGVHSGPDEASDVLQRVYTAIEETNRSRRGYVARTECNV